MKWKIILWAAVLGLLGMSGCGKTEREIKESEKVPVQTESGTTELPESETSDSSDPDSGSEAESDLGSETGSDLGSEAESDLDLEADAIIGEQPDYTYDYSDDIRADVDYVVSNSASLQEEMENIETVIQKYTPLAEAAQTQMDMNQSSRWFFVIWDTELNNLWERFSNLADEQTKENILAEQRNWIGMKEEVTLMSIGSREESGSMYPLLVNAFLEEITRDRAFILANELAKVKGESFVMPDKSAKYGLFVDNQGTGSVYSSLLARQGQSGEDEAIIAIHRLGEIEGTFVDNGNGELAFISDDESVEGIIKIYGWDGAGFTVTETSGESVFSVGEEFKFPFVF